MIKSSACIVTLPVPVPLCSLRGLEETFELQCSVPHPAVEQPVPSEHSVLVGSPCDVGPRSTGRARHEPDSLQSVLQSGPREGGSAEESFCQDAGSVVG